MTPYAVSTGDIPASVLDVFHSMRDVVETIPDLQGEDMTCHALCHALSNFFPVIYQEGYCGNHMQHGWLIHRDAPGVVLDMYPIAGASSFIVLTSMRHLPMHAMYKPACIRYDQEKHERQVTLLMELIQKVLRTPAENT